MKRDFFLVGTLTLVSTICLTLMLTSCESCTKKVAKKMTDATLSAVEGVSEALDERGEEVAKKTTDALGKIAKGTLASIGELLDEHTESVAKATGRTLVQTVEGLEKGITEGFYTLIPHVDDFAGGVALDYFGKIKDGPVVDAYFIITDNGTYEATFKYCDDLGQTLFENNATIVRTSTDSKYNVVSYALNSDEQAKFANVKKVNIKVAKK